MRITTATALVAAAAFAAALPLTAAADVYIGANGANSRINEGTFDGHDSGWKAYVGADVLGAIGLEMGYIDFGNYGVENTGANAWTPAVTLGMPIGPVHLYGKGGYAFADFQHTSFRQESKDHDPFYGVGLRFALPQGFGIRGEYERYRFNTADVDVGMLGVDYRFGGAAPGY